MTTQVYIWLGLWMLSLALVCFVCWHKNQSPALWILATMVIGPIALIALACVPKREDDDGSGVTPQDRRIAEIAEEYKRRSQ